MTKLILVEGIPGSGKTTVARKIRDYLNSRNMNTVLFCEGDPHPADLAWCSCLPVDEYSAILDKYPHYSKIINENTLMENDLAVVAYTKLGLSPSEQIVKYFESHEVYDGRLGLNIFTELHLARWRRFSDAEVPTDRISIFECAFFQNHICELMGIYNMSENFIIDHLKSLIEAVRNLNPLLIYLSQPDVGETVRRVAVERISPDKSLYSDWIDLVISWVEKSRYGIRYGLKGFDGVIRFMEDRKKLELEAFRKLPVEKCIIKNRDYDWDNVFKEIKGILNVKIGESYAG